MIKTIILSMCLAVSSLSLNARAQDERQYTEGPVTFVQEIAVEYGHFEEYIDWLNSTWKPTMEATSAPLHNHRITPVSFCGSLIKTWRH